MAEQMRRILIAIRDLRHSPKAELRKAGALARAARASVELFHAIEAPDPGASWPESVTAQTMERQRGLIATRERQRLEKFARDVALRGLTVRCTATWDHPVHEAIVRRALASRASLVIAATRGHRLGARLVLRNTDWELIRHCPLPLLLVKSPRPYQRPVVLAAVDPFHAHAKPANLDARLLEIGGRVAQALHGTLHLFHAYMPLVMVAPVAVGAAPLVMMPPEAEQAHDRQVERVVDQLAQRAGIPASRRHIRLGDVAAELAAVARRTHASLVVMGAVSRSALARLFIGNTAERVLDSLTCDVLVVKPPGARSALAPRATSAARRRGPTRRRTLPRAGRRPAAAPGMVVPPIL
jgi:universal stress protein E